jgi:hypothetical protein
MTFQGPPAGTSRDPRRIWAKIRPRTVSNYDFT